jgi:uncharacterized DUF497 family protein
MEDENFAWDDDKAARNWRDHAVTFEMAREVFRDPFAIEREDLEQDLNEERYGVIGTLAVRGLHDARRENSDHHRPQGRTL